MRLAVLGGGGFRVPLVHGALLGDASPRRVTEVVLHDTDPARLAVMRHVLEAAGAGREGAPAVSVTTELDRALDGADFVFSAIRVGGLEGRTVDERLALGLGLLGQETTGAGGVGYGLRSVPAALHIARRVQAAVPRTPGSSTSPTRRVSSRRPCSRCSVTAPSASATRRSASPVVLPGCSATTSTTSRSTTPGSTTWAGCRGCAWTAATCCPGCSPTRQPWAPSRRATSSAPTGCSHSGCSPTSTSTTTTSPVTRSRRSRREGPPGASSSSPSRRASMRRWPVRLREPSTAGTRCDVSATRPTCRRPGSPPTARAGSGRQQTSRVVATRESRSPSWQRSRVTSRPG